METKIKPTTDYAPAQLDPASKLLLGAATALEQHGWCQDNEVDSSGAMCIMGALQFAETGVKGDEQLSDIRKECFKRLSAAMGQGVRSWNDSRRRTKEEVVAKLLAVALSG